MLLAFGRDPCLGFRAKSAMFTLRPRVTTAPLFPASSSLLSASRGFLPGCILLRKMSFNARWGRACGTPFDAKRFLANHPQFDWLHGLIKDRPRQPWTRFEAVK